MSDYRESRNAIKVQLYTDSNDFIQTQQIEKSVSLWFLFYDLFYDLLVYLDTVYIKYFIQFFLDFQKSGSRLKQN